MSLVGVRGTAWVRGRQQDVVVTDIIPATAEKNYPRVIVAVDHGLTGPVGAEEIPLSELQFDILLVAQERMNAPARHGLVGLTAKTVSNNSPRLVVDIIPPSGDRYYSMAMVLTEQGEAIAVPLSNLIFDVDETRNHLLGIQNKG